MANKRECPYCGGFNRMTDEGVIYVSLQNRLYCSYDHMILGARKNEKSLARKKKDKVKKKHSAQKREDNLPKTVQRNCNEYIRLLDYLEPCISCDSETAYVWDAGHYRSVGSAPELRYNTKNINKQCRRCNNHGGGNKSGGKGWGTGYDQGIIDRFGLERLEWLKKEHPAKNYTKDDLRRLNKWFLYRVRQQKKRLGL